VGKRIACTVVLAGLLSLIGGTPAVAVRLAPGSGEHAMALARRLLAALELPLPLRITTVGVAASIGIATGGLGDTADELLRNADLAMYAAKATGGNGYALYKPANAHGGRRAGPRRERAPDRVAHR